MALISYNLPLVLNNTTQMYQTATQVVERQNWEHFSSNFPNDLITQVIMDDILELQVAKAIHRQTGLTRAVMVPRYNRSLVLAYVNTVKALISIVDPDRQVITINGRDYYYADYAVPAHSATALLIADSGRIALSPKMMKRNNWAVLRQIDNYCSDWLVSPPEFAEICDTLFNNGVDQSTRVTMVTPEKTAPMYISSLDFILPEVEADRFEDVVEIGVAGSKAESIMTQVLGRVLDPEHNLVPGDLGTMVAAEIEDEVFKYFRDVRKHKTTVVSNIDNSQTENVVNKEANSISTGSQA